LWPGFPTTEGLGQREQWAPEAGARALGAYTGLRIWFAALRASFRICGAGEMATRIESNNRQSQPGLRSQSAPLEVRQDASASGAPFKTDSLQGQASQDRGQALQDQPSQDQALQDQSLQDRPLRDRQGRTVTYLRVSVTDRCNYRCTYCMPETGVDQARRSEILSFEEIEALVRAFVSVGVRRVRITGGEPTARRDLLELITRLRRIDGLKKIALSTNGHNLREIAKPLVVAGVDDLNVSVDSLDPDRFRQITRRGCLADVLAGLEQARLAGFASIKLNMVALAGFNDHEIGPFCRYAWERGFVPRFIEQMPMTEGALFVPGALLAAAQIRRLVSTAFPDLKLVAEQRASTASLGPARYHRLEARQSVSDPSSAAFSGKRFGIISAMTEHFCDACNRVRLSARGTLHSCLAHDDAVDLRAALASGGPAAVIQRIRQALAEKRDGHLFEISGRGGPQKSMVQIGG